MVEPLAELLQREPFDAVVANFLRQGSVALQIVSVCLQQFQNLSLLLCDFVILFCDSYLPLI